MPYTTLTLSAEQVAEKAVEMVKKMKLEPYTEISVKLVAWPWSRRIIEAICAYHKIHHNYNRLDKRYEEFDIVGLEADSARAMINAIIDSVQDNAAKASRVRTSVSATETRNRMANLIVEQLTGTGFAAA